MVVEDNDFVRFMLMKFLNDFGFKEVIEASNGEEGLDKLFFDPDIIICDINMIPVDGFEFLKRKRAIGSSSSKVPVIFLTSNASSESVQKAINMEVDAYLLKPVTAEKLKEKMTLLMAR